MWRSGPSLLVSWVREISSSFRPLLRGSEWTPSAFLLFICKILD